VDRARDQVQVLNNSVHSTQTDYGAPVREERKFDRFSSAVEPHRLGLDSVQFGERESPDKPDQIGLRYSILESM